jgi:hypothetical protein
MVTSPVFSAPVQRAVPGAAATGGVVQSQMGWFPVTSEGADQAVSHYMWPSEGAAQAGGSWPALPFPSEGAAQASYGNWGYPSEGAEQAGGSWPALPFPSEGAEQAGGSWPALPFPSEGAEQAWSTGASSGLFASEGADQS